MAATVTIMRWTGAAGSPTKTDIINTLAGNTRANAIDQATSADTTYPVQIPTSGTNCSFWVSTRLSCSVTPANLINNLRWFSDGGNNFGGGITAIVGKAAAYTQATGSNGVSGNPLTTAAYAGLTSPVDPFTTYPPGSPFALTGSLNNPTTGDFGDFVVYQIVVATSALPGATTQETWTWKYDEQ
jgi:hypothetical protein